MKVSFLQSLLANRFTAVGVAALVGIIVAKLIHDLLSTHDRKMRPLLLGSVANISLLALIWAGEFAFQKIGWLPAALAWMPQQFFLPLSLLLVILASIRRSALCLWINGFATLFVAGVLMGVHFASTPALAAGNAVRVMTLEVDHWPAGVDPVARTISETRPQIVCLQGCKPAAGTPNDTFDRLRKALPGYRWVRAGQMAVGSRGAIHQQSVTALPPGPVDAPALTASVEIGSHTVTVVDFTLEPCDTRRAVHDPGGYFASFTHDRDDQAHELLASVKAIHGPILACGDFNAPPQVSGSRQIEIKLQDAFSEAGNGYGYTVPARTPYVRADRIFLGHGLSCQSIWNPSAAGSTHLPVVADVAISTAH